MDALNNTTAIPALGLPLDPVEGDPLTALRELGRFGGLEVGVWEMSPGEASDVEADEVFVVIAGTASIHFVTTGRRLEIGVGDVVRLSAGDETVWTVRETVRKVYVTAAG